ncbi:S8 family serine peptidase [Streptomyces sp. NPDC052299]|uniref:S8 family serine peptidase n=1 Tax=Streptomyces sp. NPDC052299 TaxID=3155054 RepID=UPI00342356BA
MPRPTRSVPSDRHRPRPRRRLMTGAVTLAALATGFLVPPAAGADAPAPSPDADVKRFTGTQAPRTWDVTLITGDTVHLTRDAAGTYAVTSTERPGGGMPLFRTQAGPGGVFVIPAEAQPAVDAGIVERRLFDVKYLAEHGYADSTTGELPLIVRYSGKTPQAEVTAEARALPASTEKRSLSSINGAALRLDKDGARDFWKTLDADTAASTGRDLLPKTLKGGIRRVELDARVTVNLAESVPLIGAPEAWGKGLDGSGTTVAVLDTGIDAGHPDLAGRITTSRSFVPGEEVADGHGHGTHVASTIAGSGAASDGLRKGVAPGAKLAIGKVLDNSGSGDTSGIIEGMEWAVGEADAEIVSMSLGGQPSDGTDALSEAVNELSDATGALFVIAAGNDGPTAGTINAPGAADAALTVAATDKSDQLGDFSGRGPRVDGALKPDIAAPGVNITAARAQGTAMGAVVDENYTTVSGTSMATPHVAGAAAILAQQHPDWTGSRLKATLMSTSKDDGFTVYEQGAGRVDVARATAQQLVATTAHVDFRSIPVGEGGPVDKRVAFANNGDKDVTVTLAPELRRIGGAAAEGALTVADTRLNVPAGGTAGTTVTLDPTGLPQGRYTGSLVATDDSGSRAAVPVGLDRGPKMVPLTVHVLDRDGEPADPALTSVSASAVDVPDVYGVVDHAYAGDGTYVMRAPAGTYSVTGSVIMNSSDGGPFDDFSMLAPEVTVRDGGTEITLDARKAVRVAYRTPRPVNTDWVPYSTTTVRTAWDGTSILSGTLGTSSSREYVTPTRRVTKGEFLYSRHMMFLNPTLSLTVTGPERAKLHTFEGTAPPFPAGKQKRELAYVGLGSPEEMARADLKGRIALLAMSPDPDDGPYWGCTVDNDRVVTELKAAGAVGVVLFPKVVHPGCTLPTWEVHGEPTALPLTQVLPAEGNRLRTRLESGSVKVEIDSNPGVDYLYKLLDYEEGRIPEDLTYAVRDKDLARVRTTIHSSEGVSEKGVVWTSFHPLEPATFGSGVLLPTPASYTEYRGGLSREETVGDRRVAHVLDRPERSSFDWYLPGVTPGVQRAPDVPGVRQQYLCSFCRQGDIFATGYTQVTGDGTQGDPGGYYNADARLFGADGTEIERVTTPYPGLPAFRLPEEDGVYRLVQSGAGNTSDWTFHSRGRDGTTAPRQYRCMVGNDSGACNPQPLVHVGYDLTGTVDAFNRAPAGRAHHFTVSVGHSPSTERMPAVAGLKLDYSTDGGTTWKSAALEKGRTGTYRATIDVPPLDKTSGSVSLRAQAWDTDGNRVKQTTTEVIALR